ncbi:protein Wnt-11b-2-like [Limulus polyphemus]|uniref:Protein Wnt n=1 Tax=Limulus polyphemus TaxID=6850 RepID=A0ABM1SZ21_LIMPO|nr:protein Wnt-11b-2-like [Limulus polyphemus]
MNIVLTCNRDMQTRVIKICLVSLLLISHVVALQWLAIGKRQMMWNKKAHCTHARRQKLLQGNQGRLCKRNMEFMPLIINAARATMKTCQETFADRRWNCSSIDFVPNLMHDLTAGTREQAFVSSLASAAVGHTIARACSMGSLLSCGCGRVPREPPNGAFKWGGCADNLRHGFKFARSFCDSPWRQKNRTETTEAIMNRHNNKAGRRIARTSVITQCKCHGVSGSCNIKTCWRALPKLLEVSEFLKRKYYIATEVVSQWRGKRRKLIPANSQMGMYGKNDLIFITKSPDYCLPNPKVGSLGTRGRLCNGSSSGTYGCDSMCCGRGFTIETIEKLERCHCKYYWCCYVKCKACRIWVQQQKCY